jgi:predicted GIY-YIG superfamily endonuclease
VENQKWYVYFIKEETTCLFKIGHANDVKNRLKSLQIGNPRRLIPIHNEAFGTKQEAMNFESRLHDYFRMYSMYGEWFDAKRSLDYLFEGFKKYGCDKYLEYLIDKRQRLFNDYLDPKYKNILLKLSKMVGFDIENNQMEQMEYLQQELKIFGWRISERINGRSAAIMGDRFYNEMQHPY